MANIQRYKLLMLGSTIQAFREHYEDTDPVATALDEYLTYIELLGVWPEENEPFTHAKRLAETKMLGKEQRYLLQTIEQVDNAGIDALLEVAEKYMQEHSKLISVLNKQVRYLEACEKNYLTRIDELLAAIETKQEAANDLNSELITAGNRASELEQEVDALKDDVSELGETEQQLRSSLDAAEQSLAGKERLIERLIEERNEAYSKITELESNFRN